MLTIEKRTLSVEETAQYLGIGISVAYEWARSGRIPSLRIGKRYLVPVAVLEKMLAEVGQPGTQGKND